MKTNCTARFAVAELLTLEPRTLFSASVHGHLHVSAEVTPNPAAITADLQKLSNDFQQYLTDRAGWINVYLTDIAAVKADRANGGSASAALKLQLQTDQAASQTALGADKTAMQTLYTSVQPTLAQDKANIKADMEANNSAQLAIDQSKFNMDHASAESQMQPLYQKYVTDQATWKTTLFNDRQAIENGGGTNQQQYQTDLLKLRNDAKQWRTTLRTDRSNLAADEAQLHADGYVEPDGLGGGDSNSNSHGNKANHQKD